MANKKLKNVSERTFMVAGEQTVKPGQSFVVDAATAEHLMALYPTELLDYEAEAANMTAQATTPGMNAEDMSVKQLKALLDDKGTAYKPNASKAELVALVKGTESTSATAPVSTIVEPTDLIPETELVEGIVYRDANGLYIGTTTMVGNTPKLGLLPVDQLTDEEKAVLVAAGKLAA